MILSAQVNQTALRLEIQTDVHRIHFRRVSQPGTQVQIQQAQIQQAEIQQVQSSIFSILLDGRSYEARVEPDGERVWVAIRGRRFEVRIVDPRRWSGTAAGAQTGGRENVRALMPGRIVRLLVAPGEHVAAGQALLVIEAMKMQNEMKAATTGRVVSVGVREGDTVPAGAILVTIE